jgi:Ca2+/H+ antiporter
VVIAAWLLVLVPIALGVHFLMDAGPLWTFVAAIVAIVPLAERIRRGTEQIARRAGSAVGVCNRRAGGRAQGRMAPLAITRDGEATWFEGVLLIGVYVLLPSRSSSRHRLRRLREE